MKAQAQILNPNANTVPLGVAIIPSLALVGVLNGEATELLAGQPFVGIARTEYDPKIRKAAEVEHGVFVFRMAATSWDDYGKEVFLNDDGALSLVPTATTTKIGTIVGIQIDGSVRIKTGV